MKLPMKVCVISLACLLLVLVSCGKRRKPETSAITIAGEHICVSLKNLCNEVISKADLGEPIPEEYLHLGGISWLEGYVVDDKNKDIILFGKSSNNRPPYNLSDILDSYKNVFNNEVAPYCSLDPRPENILKLNSVVRSNLLNRKDINEMYAILTEAVGEQMTVVGGVPQNSNHAFVMIDADYHMKKVSQGLINLSGITSCINIRLNKAKEGNYAQGSVDPEISMSRFWFHIKPRDTKPYPNFLENTNIVYISECPVVLLTEKQISDEKGNLKDSKIESPVARTFAGNMSESFSKLVDSVKVYAELENLYRLNALFKATKYKIENTNTIRDISSLVNRLAYTSKSQLPKSLPGLVNIKGFEARTNKNRGYGISTQFYMACGGVEMDMKVDQANIMGISELKALRSRIIKARPNNEAITWKVN